MPESYEQIDSESAPAFAAFARYRDLGPERSIRKVAELVGKEFQLIGRWSSQHRWQSRVAAYDRDLDAKRRAAHESELEELSRKQARQLARAATALMAPVEAFLVLLEQFERDGIPVFAGVDPVELFRISAQSSRFFPALAAAQRLNAGLSTSSVAADCRPKCSNTLAAGSRIRSVWRVCPGAR